jgi:hypothetical protein
MVSPLITTLSAENDFPSSSSEIDVASTVALWPTLLSDGKLCEPETKEAACYLRNINVNIHLLLCISIAYHR